MNKERNEKDDYNNRKRICRIVRKVLTLRKVIFFDLGLKFA